MEKDITIKQIDSDDELADALGIRHQIFVEEQDIPVDLEHDELDSESIHIIAYHCDKAIATARLSILIDSPAILARVAVIKEYRGEGIGQMLVRKLEEIAMEKGVHEIVLHPHDYLGKFYNDLGYHRIKGEQMAGPNKIIKMKKRIN